MHFALDYSHRAKKGLNYFFEMFDFVLGVCLFQEKNVQTASEMCTKVIVHWTHLKTLGLTETHERTNKKYMQNLFLCDFKV